MTQSDYLLNSPKLADKRTVIRYECLNSGSQHITAPALEMTVSLQPWSANMSSAQSLAFRRTPTQGPPSGARSGSPVCPSHTVTPSAMRHLPGSVKCIADHYPWRALLLWRSTALLPAGQREWENIANVYGPAYVYVCVWEWRQGHVMCASNAWGLSSIAKQLPGLFAVSKCADFRGFGVQMWCWCVCRGVCAVWCVRSRGAAAVMRTIAPSHYRK